jgi:hypothetical protein
VGRHDRRYRLGIATGTGLESLPALARVAPENPVRTGPPRLPSLADRCTIAGCAVPYKNVDDLELNGPHTLAELITYIAPLTFRRWQKNPEPLAHPRTTRNSGQVLIDSLINWTPDSPIRLKAPREAIYRRQLDLDGRRHLLFERLSDYVRDALASPRYTMAGIGPAGTMIEVPRDLADQVVIDFARNTLSTPDGGAVWRAIVVRTTSAASSLEIAAPRTAVAKPRKPTYAEIRAWYVERVAKHPPDCLPPSRPDDEAAARQYFNGKGLDGRGIRDDMRKARREVAPLSWQESGAKSSEAYEADRKARASAA